MLYLGDCLEIMPTLEAGSVDAIVTDPPYFIGFMGKEFDKPVDNISVNVDMWREVLRVAKPGAHLLAFGSPRTNHRMVVAIEDAGWEIRDTVYWVHGQGFPKSLNIGKAIDKVDAAEARMIRKYKFTEWMVGACHLNGSGMDRICGTNTMGRHWTDRPPGGKQPDVPTREYFEMLRPHFSGNVPAWVEQMVDERTIESENFKRREVVGTKTAGLGSGKTYAFQDDNNCASKEVDITAPATPEAQQWDGWGTGLKPAVEPIVLARKPLSEKTVAANVLKWGTGALNIDASRIPINGEKINVGSQHGGGEYSGWGFKMGLPRKDGQGRWPAHVIHDGSQEVMDLFPQTTSGKMKAGQDRNSKPLFGSENDFINETYGDSGSAARFFYCAKPSKRERDAGCEGMELRNNMRVNAPRENEGEKRANKMRNHHPTVKPLALMRYLITLITPPGGIVLDPFAGSGTTGVAAKELGFDFIGIEKDPEYFKIAEARING